MESPRKEGPSSCRCGVWARKGHHGMKPVAPDGRGGGREEQVSQIPVGPSASRHCPGPCKTCRDIEADPWGC